MQQQLEISRKLCGEEKNNLSGLHTVWFYLYEISKRCTYSDGDGISGCQRLKVGGACDYKGIA